MSGKPVPTRSRESLTDQCGLWYAVPMDSNTNTNQPMTDAEFCRVLTIIKDEWDRCMTLNTEILGLSRDEAAQVVGQQMTEWFNARKR